MKKICDHPECDFYPHYGVAPHECFYKKGKDFVLGQSTLLPRDQWPENFVLELLPGEKPEDVAYPSACGVYFCPHCKQGLDAFVNFVGKTGDGYHPSMNDHVRTRDLGGKVNG